MDYKQLYLIIGIIFAFFIIYVLFLLLLNIINQKISSIKIETPSNNNIIDVDKIKNDIKEQFSSYINSNLEKEKSKNEDSNDFSHHLKYETDTMNSLTGFSLYENEPYYLKKKKVIVDHHDDDEVCYVKPTNNSEHLNYKYGRTNYPNPYTMNGMDRKIFKNFYQDGMTLQDYVNWLQLHDDDGENIKLDYEHMKFYKAIKKGQKLKYIKGICPPNAKKVNKVSDSAEFYQNLYQNDIEDEIKNTKCANINFSKLMSESKFHSQKPLDLTTIQNANDLHSKSVVGSNIREFASYDTLSPFIERNGKTNPKNIQQFLEPKISNKNYAKN